MTTIGSVAKKIINAEQYPTEVSSSENHWLYRHGELTEILSRTPKCVVRLYKWGEGPANAQVELLLNQALVVSRSYDNHEPLLPILNDLESHGISVAVEGGIMLFREEGKIARLLQGWPDAQFCKER